MSDAAGAPRMKITYATLRADNEALHVAFEAALADPALVNEARQSQIDMTPRAASDLVSLLGKLYATPKDTIETVKKIIPTGFN